MKCKKCKINPRRKNYTLCNSCIPQKTNKCAECDTFCKGYYCKSCATHKRRIQRKTPEYKYKELLWREPTTDITFEFFSNIVLQPCKYCNGENFTLGLDRIKPASEGGKYTINNVVSCCKICNSMKNNFSLNMFLQHVKKIAAHLNYNCY